VASDLSVRPVTAALADGVPNGRFSLGLHFEPARVVVVVRGDVDAYSAPELAALLAGMADRRHRSLVLDLAECDFMDSAGLRAIADSSDRLAWSGRKLLVNSPPAAVRRFLVNLGSPGLTVTEGPPASPGASHHV
jgi:anti-anti-sigma factor